MSLGIFGRKVGVTQIYDDGVLVPVTVIDASECHVAQVKTKAKDGYSAIQVAFGSMKPQNAKKARLGLFKKMSVAPKRNLAEIRVESDDKISHLTPGTILNPATIFAKGDFVDVVGKSIGKGFQGVIKRHNFSGLGQTHGVHEYFRHGGSIGCRTFPGRVIKNMKMPGQMGNRRVTKNNLKVVKIEDSLILIKGAVPGADNGSVFVRPANKKPIPKERSWA